LFVAACFSSCLAREDQKCSEIRKEIEHVMDSGAGQRMLATGSRETEKGLQKALLKR
jgi:hypothetical protein